MCLSSLWHRVLSRRIPSSREPSGRTALQASLRGTSGITNNEIKRNWKQSGRLTPEFCPLEPQKIKVELKSHCNIWFESTAFCVANRCLCYFNGMIAKKRMYHVRSPTYLVRKLPEVHTMKVLSRFSSAHRVEGCFAQQNSYKIVLFKISDIKPCRYL